MHPSKTLHVTTHACMVPLIIMCPRCMEAAKDILLLLRTKLIPMASMHALSSHLSFTSMQFIY